MRMLLVAGGLGAALIVVAVVFAAGRSGGSTAAEPVRRVALMHVGTDHVPPSLGTLKARLKQLGWVQGRNVELTWRNLEPDAADAQAGVFVRDGVDVIVAFEDKSIDAAQQATKELRDRIPVVFLHPSDPVRDGLVPSLSRPNRNLTGVFGARDVVAKQLEIYQRLVPGLRRVLTLVDPKDKRTERLLDEYASAAAQLERPVVVDHREASNARELRRVFASLRPGEVDGAFLLSPSLRLNFSALTIQLAERARLPVQAHRKEWVEQGALFSYGTNLRPLGRAGARYVDSILRGASPGDLAVEEIPDVEFAINLKTASRLGIKPPQEMIIRADEVYR